jgi:hypothetical protein
MATTTVRTPSATPGRLERAAHAALLAVPVLFAVPVLYALGRALAQTIGEPHPFFGDISGTTTDARALHFGSPLYQDPADGYTPLIYTPLMAVLIAALDGIALWDGWALVLTIGAELALIALAAWLAYDRSATHADRMAAALGAVGVGAVAFWLMSFVPFNFIFAPRPDQLSWALVLIGLAQVPAAAAGSRRATAGALVLLSVGFWTKQTSLPALLAAAAWLVIAAARGRARPARAAGLIAALVAINAAVLAAIDVLTAGWAWQFIVEFSPRRARLISLNHAVSDLGESVLVPAVAAALTWGAAALGRTKSERWPPGLTAIASILALFVLIDIPAALWFRQAQGAVHNMYLGIGWALGLLLAVGWALAARRAASLGAAAGIVLALFALSESARLARIAGDTVYAHVPAKASGSFIGFEPPALRRYAEHHRVYHPAYPGIGAHRKADFYPGSDNIETLLWSGVQPRYLVNALLGRRFDLVYLFENDGQRGDSDGYGRWEENYFWKLNEVIRAKYRRVTGPRRALVPARIVFVSLAGFYSRGAYEPRPGPDPAPWMARCFGPFRIAGASWRIAAGGGFWCRSRPGGSTLRLVATRANMSEIRVDDLHAGRGAVVPVRFKNFGRLEIRLGSWHVVRLLPGGGRTVVRLPAGARGALRVVASRGSGADVDLARATGHA